VRELQYQDEGVLRPKLQVAATGRRWRRHLALAIALGAALLAQPAAAQRATDATLTATLGQLRDASYADKQRVAQQLAGSGHPSARPVLLAFLEDRLYVRTADQLVFIVTSADESAPTFELIDPVSQKPAGSVAHDALEKIGTNNSLRKFLRTTVARFDLANPDPTVRLAAVDEMLRSLDEESLALLKQRMGVETDRGVRQELETGVALATLDGDDHAARVSAVATLAHSLKPQVQNRLASLVETGPDGTPTEHDDEVRRAAAAAVRRIDRVRMFYGAFETLFFGLSVGSVLVLIATGLAITFGVMGVINMAHGELMMLGAYTTYAVQLVMPHQIGISVLVAVPAAFLVAGATGIVLERTIIRFLYGRPLETLLATFGVSLVLQQLVRSVFSANNRSVETPAWMSGTIQVNDALSITANHLAILLFAGVVFAMLVLILKRTRLGLEIRAVSQNRAMAQAMGIRTDWVDAMAFGLGSGIAGVAGVALSQFTNVGPNLGQSYIIDSFMVVVFGGVGNLWGTLVGGMSMGVVNQLLEPFAGAVLAKIAVLLALILFIQRWPRGLFPQTGRAAESQ
jgi:urea transport system permease protein